MQLNRVGQVVAAEWVRLAVIRKELQLDSWIIMPNHLHGIVIISSAMRERVGENHECVGAHGCAPLRGMPRS